MNLYTKTKIQLIAKNCRRLREGRKITRNEIAKALGVTQSAIASFEAGNIDGLSYIIAYSNVLQVSVSYLMEFDARELWEKISK